MGAVCGHGGIVVGRVDSWHVVIGSPSTRALVALPWLLRVRWWLVCGQAAVIAVASVGLRIDLPLTILAPLVVAAAVSNAIAPALAHRVPAAHLGGSLLLVDVLLLTGLLSVTGGPLNPFSMQFLVYITLAAVVLGSQWTWTITVASALGFGSLFFLPVDEHTAIAHALSGQLGGHLQGMWWAFATAAMLTAVFVVRLSKEIDARDQELEVARDRAARTERLASLTTLAAGAAHELSTPLSTIAVAAGELERTLSALPSTSNDVLDDVRLIQEQLARARGILDRLGNRAGDPAGEMPSSVSLDQVLADALQHISRADHARVMVSVEPIIVLAPPTSLTQCLAGLIRNGLEAPEGVSGARPSVKVSSHVEQHGAATSAVLTIQDDGGGIPTDQLTRVGEPFFTTKAPGKGMGLGVFLARLLATELGGTLHLTSHQGSGTTVTMRLPMGTTR
jgi:two-component system sensor histidine kinase RegB